MGYHIILRATVRIKPEHIDFISPLYFFNDTYPYESLPAPWSILLGLWQSLGIGHHFYLFDLDDDIFTFELQKKVTDHGISLERNYKEFMYHVILPVADEILSCEIEHDDFGCHRYEISDAEIRSWTKNSIY